MFPLTFARNNDILRAMVGRNAEFDPRPRGTFLQVDPPASPGGRGSAGEAKAPRIGMRERIQMIRKPAIVPSEFEIVKPEYDPREFAEKVVLITGVSHFRGFGYETAKRLVEMGAKAVAFNYRVFTNEVADVILDLEERVEQTGTQIVAFRADIARVDEALSVVSKVVEQTGRLDVYIDNAGRIAMGALDEQTPEQVLEDTMTNIVGPQIILGEVVKQMKAQRGGRVVEILSPVADGGPGQSRYAGAKAYKFAAARSGAIESLMTRSGITYVSLAPGLSPTTMTEVVEEKSRPGLMSLIGQQEEIAPSDVAEYIVYAASSLVPEELNGQVIPVYRPMASAQASTYSI